MSAPSASAVPIPGLSALSVSAVLVPGSSAPSPSAVPMPRLSAPCLLVIPVPGLFALSVSVMPKLGFSAPSASAVPLPGSSALFPSTMRMPGLSAPSTSAVPVLGLSTLFASALPVSDLFAPSASAVLVPKSSTLPLSTVSTLGLSVFSAFVMPVPVSFPPFLIWLFPQTPTLVPRKQRLGQSDQIIKRASLEEVAPIFASLLPLVERLSPLLLPFSGTEEKRSFNMAFSLDWRPLANDHTKKDVNLSFGYCQCLPAVKTNRPWERELLDRKFICMVKAIPLAATIFWDLNFVFYTRHTLILPKKLGLKRKNIKNDLVTERIRQIWANKTIIRLDKLFANNPDWWYFIASIFSQLTLKNKNK